MSGDRPWSWELGSRTGHGVEAESAQAQHKPMHTYTRQYPTVHSKPTMAGAMRQKYTSPIRRFNDNRLETLQAKGLQSLAHCRPGAFRSALLQSMADDYVAQQPSVRGRSGVADSPSGGNPERWSGSSRSAIHGLLGHCIAADAMGERASKSFEYSGESPIQSKGTYGGVIQRAVGFEFQTGWHAYKKQTFLVPWKQPVEESFPKETSLYGSRNRPEGWAMETDGRDIEFVIEPAVDEVPIGITRLSAVMDNLRNFTDNLQALGHRAELKRNKFPNLFNANVPSTALIEPKGQIKAQPQATVGVRLEYFPALFDTINISGSRGGDFARHSGANYPASKAQRVVTAVNAAGPVNGTPPSAKLKGLLTLVVEYLLQGNQSGSRDYVKDMAFVMARTDFAAIFNELDDSEKRHFQTTPGSFSDYALTVAGMAGQGNEPLIRQRITDGGTTRPGVQLPLTRGEWLDAMSSDPPRDLLTKAATQGDPLYQDSKGHSRLRALGLLGNKFDRVGPHANSRGVIVELRQMKREIPATEWKAVALAVMRYIIELNAIAPGGALPDYVEH